MDTVAYSELLVNFGKGLMRTAEGAEAAADNDTEGDERARAIAQARAKLAEYEGVLARLATDSKALEAQFAKRFAESMDLIRESLQRIDAEDAS